jgi:MFS family permease
MRISRNGYELQLGNNIGRGDSMEARRIKILTIVMGILLLLAFFALISMIIMSVGNLLGLSFYLIAIGLSMSFFIELSISKTISAKKFSISFKEIRWSRILLSGFFMVYAFLGNNIQLVEGPSFPNFFDWWTWLFLVVFLISWIMGNYIARHLLYPKGDVRLSFYDALAEKNE